MCYQRLDEVRFIHDDQRVFFLLERIHGTEGPEHVPSIHWLTIYQFVGDDV